MILTEGAEAVIVSSTPVMVQDTPVYKLFAPVLSRMSYLRNDDIVHRCLIIYIQAFDENYIAYLDKPHSTFNRFKKLYNETVC